MVSIKIAPKKAPIEIEEDEAPIVVPVKKKKKLPNRSEAVIFLRGIDNDLHANFKAWCAKRGKSMREVFVAFMEHKVKGSE